MVGPQVPRPWPDLQGRLGYGGDYNPEQWPEDVRREDVRLMRQAGVTFVTLGVFSWSVIEPRDGQYTFGWLDRVMDDLAEAGIAVDLATATASPPPWLTQAHPEMLPVLADGTTQWPGSRQSWCPSSPVMREHTTRLAGVMAQRYGDHPALAMWHVSNEYGCHNTGCHCDVSAAAFRRWLADRYRTIDELNRAWGTRVWSQVYSSFEQVLPPRTTPTFRNPGQVLDYRRFTSDELLACYVAERDVLRDITPAIPITTNFMVMGHFHELDYWRWAEEVDLVSSDHYVLGSHPRPHVELALSADIVRGLAGGQPWFLMEHSTSAVSWQTRNLAKAAGQMRRDSLAHLAHGADAIGFFQWRQAALGAERWHSAMLPHAGTESRRWHEITALGNELAQAAALAGSVVQGDVGLVFDFESWWALLEPGLPTRDLDYRQWVEDIYTALYDLGVTVDILRPGHVAEQDHRVVIVPAMYLMAAEEAADLERFVRGGGRLVVTASTGLADRHDRIHLGGYPGVLRELLGITVEELHPLAEGATVALSDGSRGTVWSEEIRRDAADAVVAYTSGPLQGRPAITRRSVGDGTATYVSTGLTSDRWAALLRAEIEASGDLVVPPPPDVDVVTRRSGQASWQVVINHSGQDVAVAHPGAGPGKVGDGTVEVPAGDVVIIAGQRGRPD